jgi:3-hydroxybutyryl-CoA dehydrogenase
VTSDETVKTLYDLLQGLGKVPVVVRKEAAGFVGNRLQAALFREALSIVGQGIATAEDVDRVVRNGFGRRLAAAGVFEIWEIAGWDLVLAICENLFPVIESSGTVPALLRDKVSRGELGVKAGKGFYEYSGTQEEILKNRDLKLLRIRKVMRELDAFEP